MGQGQKNVNTKKLEKGGGGGGGFRGLDVSGGGPASSRTFQGGAGGSRRFGHLLHKTGYPLFGACHPPPPPPRFQAVRKGKRGRLNLPAVQHRIAIIGTNRLEGRDVFLEPFASHPTLGPSGPHSKPL